MNNNEGNVGMGAGGISILAIFVVLCLTTLAALSLVSAQADYALAERTVGASQEYYDADARAEERVAEIVNTASGDVGWQETLAAKGYTVEEDSSMKETLVHEESGETWESSTSAVAVSFTEDINDTKHLYAEVVLLLDGAGAPTGEWRRASWQVVVTGQAGEVEAPPVFQENQGN